MIVEHTEFTKDCISGTIGYSDDKRSICVKGKIDDNVGRGIIEYLAAKPVATHMNLAAAGLPHANGLIAFANTPNKGSYELMLGNRFEIWLDDPGSYYVGGTTVLVDPTLYIRYRSVDKIKIVGIKVNEPVPYRTLTWPMKARSTADPWTKPVRSMYQMYEEQTYPIKTSSRNPPTVYD